ncbi:MAG: glutaredoxin family protein [Acidobacteria bacterium]|nr:glutaredoxin family protein [Acidobacteriota bacterium]
MKEFLSRNKVEFVERNIAADPTALAELEGMGYHTTPVTMVGKEFVVGFDRARLEELLRG